MKGTIKAKDDVEKVFSHGTRVNTKYVLLIIDKQPLERGLNGRVAFIAGKKLGSAPKRSYSKRVMRHAAQLIGAPWSGYDVIFVAKKPILNCNFKKLVTGCRCAIEDQGL